MDSNTRVAVVTGGYGGIGLAICKGLAKEGLRIVLAGRNPNKGNANAEDLQVQGFDVVYAPLDVDRTEDIQRLSQFVDHKYGRLDVLVNNAGIFPDSSAQGDTLMTAKIETIQQGFETNVYGPIRLCQALIPLMKRNHYGRIVNVSSGMGQLSEMGGGSPAYRLSKTALNAVTCMLSAELEGTNILVNSMCPGWVRTEMGGQDAPRSPEEGADTAIWLATLPDDGETGGFFRDRKPIAW